MNTLQQGLTLHVIEPTAENAAAWCDSLEAASVWQPGAFSAGGTLDPAQREEARRYFFAAGHDNDRLRR